MNRVEKLTRTSVSEKAILKPVAVHANLKTNGKARIKGTEARLRKSIGGLVCLKTGSHYEALAVLELAMQTRLASNS